MTETVTLYGYTYSVYAWIVRFALHEKGVTYDWIEVDPFVEPISADYLALNPFRRVPTLQIKDFTLYETSAITRFVDETYDQPSLQPSSVRERARVNQILSIVDQYAYWPMVRQVFTHSCFLPRSGENTEQKEIDDGLAASMRVLSALERLTDGSPFLIGENLTLADIHLAPVFSYFCEVDAAADMVGKHPRLSEWWEGIRARSAFVATLPDLDSLTVGETT